MSSRWGKPEVIYKIDPKTGKTLEPFEELYVEVPEESLGALVEMLGVRQAQMLDMQHGDNGIVTLKYKIPTRGMIGLRGEAMTATRGMAIMHALFYGYEPQAGAIHPREHGSLIAFEDGMAVTYGLRNAWERGVLFIEAMTPIYEGMVVGEHQRPRGSGSEHCQDQASDQLPHARCGRGYYPVAQRPPHVVG